MHQEVCTRHAITYLMQPPVGRFYLEYTYAVTSALAVISWKSGVSHFI
jgi:hypothetical protein